MGKSSRRHPRYSTARERPPQRRARWQHSSCKACGQPVIEAEERRPDGRLRGALLDDAPGMLARDAEGYVTRDLAPSGTRYSWHHCPVRNAAG